MLRTSIGRLRAVSLLEGLSYLILLYCSIVMKRIQGHEDAIYLPGMIHGVLFVLLCLLLSFFFPLLSDGQAQRRRRRGGGARRASEY